MQAILPAGSRKMQEMKSFFTRVKVKRVKKMERVKPGPAGPGGQPAGWLGWLAGLAGLAGLPSWLGWLAGWLENNIIKLRISGHPFLPG